MSGTGEFESWVDGELRRSRMGVAVAQPAPRQSIFKYVSLNTEMSWGYFKQMVEEFSLIGSISVGLNDPFELSPALFDDLRPKTISSIVKNRGNLSVIGANEDYDDVVKYRDMCIDYLDKMKKSSRVVSFCERSDSPLLWSHYANSYRGACIHFLAGGFTQFSAKLGYVGYSNYRPIYPLSLALRLAHAAGGSGDISRAESEKFLYYTKAKEWEYEAELRIIYNISRLSAAKFDPECMLSVIVGPRMSDHDLNRIGGILADSPLSHVPIRRATLSENSFSVEIGSPPQA